VNTQLQNLRVPSQTLIASSTRLYVTRLYVCGRPFACIHDLVLTAAAGIQKSSKGIAIGVVFGLTFQVTAPYQASLLVVLRVAGSLCMASLALDLPGAATLFVVSRHREVFSSSPADHDQPSSAGDFSVSNQTFGPIRSDMRVSPRKITYFIIHYTFLRFIPGSWVPISA
jgi:hypothetical protein